MIHTEDDATALARADGGRAPRLILVAQVAGAFGVRGEVRITAHTESPENLLAYGPLRRGDGSVALTLIAGRSVKGALIATAREALTREEAHALRGLRLYIDRAVLPEPDEDEFYLTDLVGLLAVSPDGGAIGHVKAVNNFGAGDLLEIAPNDGGASWWTPFTKAAVPSVSVPEGRLVIALQREGDAAPTR